MINWLKYTWLYFTISAVFIIPGIISLFLFGIKPSIDFVGGSMMEVQLQSGAILTTADVTTAAGDTYTVASVQPTGNDRFIIRGGELTNEQKDQIVEKMSDQVGQVEVLRFENIGPTLSKELLSKTLVALGIVTIIILLYVARQFSSIRFGVSAILAMVHDMLLVIGCFSLFGYFFGVEVDVLFVTALLTTLSFSVHDTIVVFDRIRELQHTHAHSPVQTVYNTAVTETMTRSINNSVTIILMLLTLALLGGETTRWFAVALLIGSIAGTYSSPFVAVPILWVWHLLDTKLAKRKHKQV